MNSYISLILEAEGAKERLRRLFQSAPEPEKPGCAQLCLSEELALIIERSSKEVVPVEFEASARARLALKQTGLIRTVEEETAVAKALRQRPNCVAAFATSLGYFLAHLYP
jgi:Putative neutral zinc metallopeptidase